MAFSLYKGVNGLELFLMEVEFSIKGILLEEGTS